ncbi:transporter [Stutzerimonas xanthomarina]|uniref:urea transporter n=1 Tax=Stutzerimonas nitrititolerans TaxID=2482751 RepID=UPI0008258C28|nr:urea transporter [Stutzerimonas nitrititolerans]OCX16675.1 transporter [Stutzerimonas xanthomarina]
MPTLSPSRCTTAVLNGFSQIFLQAHPGCGLLILLAITLHAPGLMIGAMVGALVGTFSAVALGYRKSDIAIGLYGYNAALLGLLFVLLLGLSALTLGLVALGSVVTNLLQVRLMAAMRERNWLPGFTLPFVLFGWLALTLAGALELVTPARLDAPLILDGQGLLFAVASGIGQVIFLGQPLAGLLVLVAVWLADRRAAAWMLCGSVGGLALVLAAGGSEQQALAGLAGYNPALAALAVSQVHRSWVAPLLAIIAAVLLRAGFDRLGLPPLTMPFIMACWLVALGRRWKARRREPV